MKVARFSNIFSQYYFLYYLQIFQNWLCSLSRRTNFLSLPFSGLGLTLNGASRWINVLVIVFSR
jgi:hypothetical protein